MKPRDLVREGGVTAVADALELAGTLDLGGTMTAERGRELDRRRSETRPATEPEIRAVSTTPASLAADIARHIYPARDRFGEALWLGGTL